MLSAIKTALLSRDYNKYILNVTDCLNILCFHNIFSMLVKNSKKEGGRATNAHLIPPALWTIVNAYKSIFLKSTAKAKLF